MAPVTLGGLGAAEAELSEPLEKLSPGARNTVRSPE